LQVDLQIDNDGVVLICNADQKIDDEPFKNEYFVTYDEYQTPTILEWEAGRDNIEQALALDNVLNREITGNGSLLFSTLGEKFSDEADAANGYTVVLDAKNQAQETYDEGLFDFSGKTTVGSAFLVVKGGSNYGSATASSQFDVYGESYRLDSVSEKGARWEVRSCGMLGFYRGDETDPTKAPSISAGRVRFHNGLSNGEDANADLNNFITKGSRIWIDATYRDENGKIAQVDHKLGAINAKELIFGSGTEIWYDGVSSVAPNVKMTFELNADAIGIGDNVPIARATDEEISTLFSQALLVDASYKRNDPNSNSMAGTVTVTSRNLADYASDVGMSAEEIKYAQKLDEARLRTEADQAFNDALYNETDASKVTQTIRNLSLLGYDMLNAQGRFGNPTSAFFGGSGVSGEAKRGQEAEEDWDDKETPKQESVVEKEQNVDPFKRTLWAAYTHTSVEGDDYSFGGIKTHGYKLRRDGVIGGVKRQIDATTSGGLFFGISTPEITSNKEFKGRLENGASYGYFASSMEMTDFQFAVHVEKVFADVWELAAYVGGGTQAMDWERKVNLTNGGLYGFDASGSGNTFTATLYLSNRLDVGDRLTLRPTIGVDSEHSWLYGFAENAIDGESGNGVAVDYYMNMFAQNYAYAKTYYNRNTARVGLSLACDAPAGFAGLNARIFYGVKLGGDDAPELSYRSDQYYFKDMASHEMGDSSLNVGGVGFMRLNRQKTLTATGDVNAIWYKNAQTFNVTGGVSYRF